MEEDWDLLNSVHSSQSKQSQNVVHKQSRPSLNFNRFYSMPPFQLEEDSVSSVSYEKEEYEERYPQQYENYGEEGEQEYEDYGEEGEQEYEDYGEEGEYEEYREEVDEEIEFGQYEEYEQEGSEEEGYEEYAEEEGEYEERLNEEYEEEQGDNYEERQDNEYEEEHRLQYQRNNGFCKSPVPAKESELMITDLSVKNQYNEDHQAEELEEEKLTANDSYSTLSDSYQFAPTQNELISNSLETKDRLIANDHDLAPNNKNPLMAINDLKNSSSFMETNNKNSTADSLMTVIKHKEPVTDYNEPIVILNDSSDSSSKMIDNEQSITRESLVDKNTIWRNTHSVSGSSVPYMSTFLVKNKEAEKPINRPIDPPSSKAFPFSFFGQSAQLPFSPTSSTNSMSKVDTTLNNKLDIYSESLIQSKSSDTIEPLMKSISLSTDTLHSFAAAPKEQLLIDYTLDQHDIPPVEEEKENIKDIDPAFIRENVSKCFEFAHSNTDQRYKNTAPDRLSYILNRLERICPIKSWCQLTRLDLSHQRIKSLENLNKYFPALQVLDISHNYLKSLSDLPNSLIQLNASNNDISEIDIYHLEMLQELDVSSNHINAFEDMSEMKSLKTLNASHNSITSCKRFQNIPVLSKLSLKSNCIRRLINFQSIIKENHIEILDVSYNRIDCIDSIEKLKKLRYLNAEHNDIKSIQLTEPLKRLYKLQLSFNQLRTVDVSVFPGIRTLYLDDNSIHHITGTQSLSRIETLSLRDQDENAIEFDLHHLRGARKLYLSGFPFYQMSQLIDFYPLEYLELCASNIESLPANFSKQVPNLSTLYLSMNRLSDIEPLRKLKYLNRLVLMENRIINMQQVTNVVQQLRRLRYLDLRQNPISTNIYPTVKIQSAGHPDNLSPYLASALDTTWEATDSTFCLTLSSQWLKRRNVYRSLIIQNCPKLIELDHVTVTSLERSESDNASRDFTKPKSISFDSQQS